MSPAVAFLIAEMVKIMLQRLNDSGKYSNLTEEDARAIIDQISAGLSTTLPSPEDLERDGA